MTRLEYALIQDRRRRATEAVDAGLLGKSEEWRKFMAVVVFSKEGAERALAALKNGDRATVKEFLVTCSKVLPTEDSYKREESKDTDKQKRRKAQLVTSKQEKTNGKAKHQGQEESPRRSKRRRRVVRD